jgi:hypothetical protein
MSTAPVLAPVVIDEPKLQQLASAGFRWTEGHAELVRYRWLLPPDWVLAAQLPAAAPQGIQPLCGAGDRAGRLTAVLGFLRGVSESPETLLRRGAAAGALFASFRSRAGMVAERIERRGGQGGIDGKLVVSAVHAFTAGGAAYRFFLAAVGPAADPHAEQVLRTVASALSLANDLDHFRAGKLHG